MAVLGLVGLIAEQAWHRSPHAIGEPPREAASLKTAAADADASAASTATSTPAPEPPRAPAAQAAAVQRAQGAAQAYDALEQPWISETEALLRQVIARHGIGPDSVSVTCQPDACAVQGDAALLATVAKDPQLAGRLRPDLAQQPATAGKSARYTLLRDK